MDPRYRVEISCLLFGEDVGHCCPTRDFMTVDVLCSGVHVTDYIRLVHQFTCICPHAADSMQDGQAEEFWLWQPDLFIFLREDTVSHYED